MQFTKDIHFSPDIESSVLGVCLLEKSAFSRVYDLIDKEIFYYDGNQVVYESIREMYNSGVPIDLTTVCDYLMRIKGVTEITAVNVPYYLTKLSQSVVSSSNIEYHSHCLREMWTKRELIKLTYGGVKDEDVKESIGNIYSRLEYIRSKALSNEWKSMDELIVGLYKHQDKMMETGGMGITTGFKGIDRSTGGFHNGQLIVIGARPSVGKSALAGQMAIEMARDGKKVGIISLEMSNDEIAARIGSIDSNTDFNVLYRGLYRDESEMANVHKRLNNHTSKLPIFVSDKTDVNVNEIRAKANKLKSSHGLDVLMIDYLQLVGGDEGRNTNREQQVGKISRGCKIMAKEMCIPVIALCQLNREVTKRKGSERHPQLSDLRESGSLEQDADIVIFLHSDYMSGIEVDENGNSTEFQRDIVSRKWRNGTANWVKSLDFDAPKMKFIERSNIIPIPASYRQPYKEEETPF